MICSEVCFAQVVCYVYYEASENRAGARSYVSRTTTAQQDGEIAAS